MIATNLLQEFAQPESIPISGGFTCLNTTCPESERDDTQTNKRLIGWCFDHGYYAVFECQGCFEKYRHHLLFNLNVQDKQEFFKIVERQLRRQGRL